MRFEHKVKEICTIIRNVEPPAVMWILMLLAICWRAVNQITFYLSIW